MKKKIFLLIVFILVISVFAILYFRYIKKDTDDKQFKEYSKNEYLCSIETDWNKFTDSNKDLNGYELGKYKRVTKYSFDIINNEYLSNTYYEIKLLFENIDGYAYLSISDGFEEEFDENSLTKKFISKNIIPEEFTDNNDDKYIKKLEKAGYKCNKKRL